MVPDDADDDASPLRLLPDHRADPAADGAALPHWPSCPSGHQHAAAAWRPRSSDLAASALLLPLARAQDAVARLEAALDATSPELQHGLCARVSLTEAAGWLAQRHAAPVH